MIETTALDGVVILRTPRFADARGWFMETWSDLRWRDALDGAVFVQDNQSLSIHRHTVRGLHFQRAPFAQAKLVRVVRGSILDVAVDIRPGSPTFGHHVAVELSAATADQLFVPVGFAHGFMTLEPETEVAYKVSAPYAPQAEGGIVWHDPALAIPWPAGPDGVHVSQKDALLPPLSGLAPEQGPVPGKISGEISGQVPGRARPERLS